MRHHAWLNTAPRPKQRERGPRLTRLKRLRADLKDDTYEPPMPPIDAGGHVVDYLLEVGPVINGGAITHEELGWWQRNIGVTLRPWEVRFVHALSQEYLAEISRAEDPEARAPWEPNDSTPAQRAVVAAGLRNAIRGMANL